ncbi:hypothetical protein [Sulfurimonas marina]|uniref:Uncharacterized protein n=1 Tax=Sulfurimonas marina TaxID=2590551 RepID=A0A7M3V9E1_9BACT|nr:hypothetical protein [Sulfurimonas marina]QOP40374.1 hypothetical protein FJR03_00900 [Sulfurimonas marina]
MKYPKFYENFDLFYEENKDNDAQIVLFLAEGSSHEIKKLQVTKLSIYGAVFPEIIFENIHYKTGILAISLKDKTQITIVAAMQRASYNVLKSSNNSYPLFMDGFSKYINSFLEKFFVAMDHNVTIFGGGKGRLTLNQKQTIFDIVKKYPLGIETYHNENDLLLVGCIEENTIVYLLKDEETPLIETPQDTLDKPREFFIIDYISRVLFLEDHFTKRLHSIKKMSDAHTLCRLLSLGELTNNSNRYIELCNQTNMMENNI